ncbi:MAG: TonB-dependent receptor plug domain-containing protein [Nibricoccus sp.]
MRSSRVRTLQQAAVALAMFAVSASLQGQTAPAAQPASSENPDDVVTLEKLEIKEMREFSDQAISGKTPVSFSEVGKDLIASQLGSRDIPHLLNNTPSVYATADGGGAGDARINVRGFSQRNVSILINGVPTNDIENGWLYWSNWDGLGDVTSTIQMQRGLSNVTLPTPSIGGTMNVITDPASSRRGGSLKFEVGSDDFYKATAVYSTGMLADKFAVTAGLVGKSGQGYSLGTWTRGMGYYLGSTWKVSQKNRLEFFLVGAPQEHGQRRFASNIAAYDVGYARELGYTETQIYNVPVGGTSAQRTANAGALYQGPVNSGLDFNPNYAPVSKSYTGQQYYWGGIHSRMKEGYLNESVNYFHKPQANVNWYLTINDDLKLTSVFYYSGGRGGGSGTLNNGSSGNAFARYANTDPNYGSNINWDGTIASNRGSTNAVGGAKTAGQSLGILRNSVNNQDQFGAVSKLAFQATPELKLTTGLDWRTATIDHFREIRDLLGGDYYLPTAAQASEFWSTGANTRLGLGDKVDYFNTNTVDWLGLFAQGQYDRDAFSAFAVYGFSTIKYTFEDLFRRANASSNETYKLEPGSITGQQIKGGVNYAFTKSFSTFVNAGWVSKVPIYDGVINDIVGKLVTNPSNEKFTSIEAGVRWEPNQQLKATASIYHTLWRERTISVTNETADSITYLRGVGSNYSGFEAELAYQPLKWVRFDGALSIGQWVYTNDVQGEAYSISSGAQIAGAPTYYLKDLKVGDAPQSQIAYGVTFYPVHGLKIRAEGRWYDRYWSDFTPESRNTTLNTAAPLHIQPWRVRAYTVYDLHIDYDLPFRTGPAKFQVFAHVFNVLNKKYVSDATDESSFEAVGTNLAARHSAQRAEVFFGTPISFNTGVKVSF